MARADGWPHCAHRGAAARAGAAAASAPNAVSHCSPPDEALTFPRSASSFAPAPAGARRDARPLADRAFLADMAASVTSYLQDAGYAATPLTARTLTSPTTKEFASVALFMLRRLDPATPAFARFEDDVAAAFRRLRYPFALSKTSLCSIGAPHSWPPLLGALSWLAELLRYVEAARAAKASPVDPAAAHRAAFNAFVAEAYRAFMEGDDAGAAAVAADTGAAWAEREEGVSFHCAARAWLQHG